MSQGSVYSEFIGQELSAEYSRWRRIETQGFAIVVVSSVAMFAAAAFGNYFHISDMGNSALVTSVGVFFVAHVLGWTAAFLRTHDVADAETLQRMLRDHWTDNEIDARNNIAHIRLKTLESVRNVSNTRARLLYAALVAQILGSLPLILSIVLFVFF